MKRLILIAAAISIILSVFIGCSSTPATEQPQSQDEAVQYTDEIDHFIIGTTMDIKSISRSDYYFNVLSGTLTHMTLVRIDESGSFENSLAENYSTEDSKEWKFKLREDITWHDGEKLTAHDVKFTLDYLSKQGENTSPGFAKLESVEVTGDYEINFIFPKSYSRLLTDLTTLRILPKHIFEDVEDIKTFTDPSSAIGCGNYEFQSFDSQSGIIVFTANEKFPLGRPNIDKITVRLFKNTDTLYMALEKGEIDMVYFYSSGVDEVSAQRLEQAGGVTLQSTANTGVPAAIYFNTQAKPVDNADIRKGIAYSLDYSKLKELFGTKDAKTSSFGFIPESKAEYTQTKPLEMNRELAAAHFEAAGAKDTNNDGVLELSGQDIELELLIRTDKPVYARIAELISQNLKDAGIKVKFKSVDAAQFRTISEKEKAHTFMLTSSTPFGVNSGSGMATSYMDSRNYALANIKDPVFQELSDRMSEATPDKYPELCKEVQQYYAENVPAIALYQDSYIQAYRSEYEGFKVDGTFGIANLETWASIKKRVK